MPATLKIDRTPPRVRVRVNGSSVTVRVGDGAKGQGSGVNAGSVRVSFGVGGRGGSAHGRTVLGHRYATGGTYTIDRHRLRQGRQPAQDPPGG